MGGSATKYIGTLRRQDRTGSAFALFSYSFIFPTGLDSEVEEISQPVLSLFRPLYVFGSVDQSKEAAIWTESDHFFLFFLNRKFKPALLDFVNTLPAVKQNKNNTGWMLCSYNFPPTFYFPLFRGKILFVVPFSHANSFICVFVLISKMIIHLYCFLLGFLSSAQLGWYRRITVADWGSYEIHESSFCFLLFS